MLAITGCTGFIGGRLLAHRLPPARLLVRRADFEAPAGCELVRGTLEDRAARERLLVGAEVVLHLAGAIAAPNPEGFMRVNAEATAALVREAAACGVRRFILVSSLAARHPDVSWYGLSKRRAEEAAREEAGRMELVIVRPPAVYGPGDRATLDIFRALHRGWLPAPAVPQARFALLYVDDLARLLKALATTEKPPREVLEPCDGKAEGYRWRDVAEIAARILERPVRLLPVPRPIAFAAAWLADRWADWSGRPSPLPRDRVRQFYHPDWRCRGGCWSGWRPEVGFAEGFRRTSDWYLRAGWLKGRARRPSRGNGEHDDQG